MENEVSKQTKIKSNKKRVNIFCVGYILVVFLLIFFEVKSNGSYLDEIIGLTSAGYLLFYRKNIQRYDIITIIILFAVAVLGVISNLVSGLTHNWFSICIDLVSETKLLFAYFAVKYMFKVEEKQKIVNNLLPFAKLYTILSFIFSVISLFADIGMTGGERYGVKGFKFFFTFQLQYIAVYMLVFAILVFTNKMATTTRYFYYTIGLISLLSATKSPAIMFTIIFIGLSIYFKKHDKIKIWTILIGAVVIVLAGRFQIETYLIDKDSPRRIFFEYSFKTANEYFPLGSGFATYGSDQAARNYSQLYYLYGFDKIAGLTPDNPAFSSDTFWPMAIGQFGWVGSIMYFIVYLRVFFSMTKVKTTPQKKAYLYAAYLQHIINAIGSAILSSSAGMIGFLSVALVSQLAQDNSSQDKRLKVRF